MRRRSRFHLGSIGAHRRPQDPELAPGSRRADGRISASPAAAGRALAGSDDTARQAVRQPPNSAVTTLAAGHGRFARRSSAASPRRRACVRDQSYDEGRRSWSSVVRCGSGTSLAGGRLSAAAGCAESPIRRSLAVTATRSTRLPQPSRRCDRPARVLSDEASVANAAARFGVAGGRKRSWISILSLCFLDSATSRKVVAAVSLVLRPSREGWTPLSCLSAARLRRCVRRDVSDRRWVHQGQSMFSLSRGNQPGASLGSPREDTRLRGGVTPGPDCATTASPRGPPATCRRKGEPDLPT